MLKSECRIGTKVYFGRENGERTLGEIVKLNPTKAKVKALEQRSNGRGSTAGAVWGVPYSMLTLAVVGVGSAPFPAPKEKVELVYKPFDHIENLILEAILSVYIALSPENLSADGELPFSVVVPKRNALNRQLRGLNSAFGREVDEAEVYGWRGSKTAYENTRKKA